jgi:hypothetical protein
VKSSSCDYPEKIPVDVYYNASYFTSFSSGSDSPKVAEFCLNLRLLYVIAYAYASTCALSSVYSLPCNNFVQKVVPQAEKVFVTTFKDFYMSLVPKIPIIIPQAALSHQALGTCIHVKIQKKFTPSLCNYSQSPSQWDLQFLLPLIWELQRRYEVHS